MKPTALGMAAIALTVFVLALGPASTASSQDQPIYGRLLLIEHATNRQESTMWRRAGILVQVHSGLRLGH